MDFFSSKKKTSTGNTRGSKVEGVAVVTDSDGVPLNIPDEFMREIIEQVLKESTAGLPFNKNDKIAVAALRRIEELKALGADALQDMSDDTIAQIVLTQMTAERKDSETFTRKVANPSDAHRQTMVFTEEVPAISEEDSIMPADIAKLKGMEDKIELFKKAVKSCLVPQPSQDTYSKALRKLGEGGSGKVYHCVHNVTTEHVAIKVMELAKQPKLDLLLEELRLVRSLNHENIINFIESFMSENKSKGSLKEVIYVVMEYLDGNALYAFLCNKDHYYLKEPEIAYISHCSHGALAFLHSKGIIHRDIKSDNILVGKDGRCKVTDFGFCAKVEKNTLRKTQIGTPCWMPPEMLAKAKDRGYDHRIDSWSFGITLIECLNLNPPFIDMPPMEAMVAISRLKGMPPCKKLPKASADLKDFMTQHLIIDYTKRPASADLIKHPFLKKACTKEHFGRLVSSVHTEFS